MLKKFLSMLCMTAAVLTLLSGCADKQTVSVQNQDKLKIVSTVFAPYDFSRQIVKDYADITMLIPPASEAHSYEPSPQDIITILDSDMFIYVGGESDMWIEDILQSVEATDVKIVTLMDCVELYEEELSEGMQAEQESSDASEDEKEYDEHIWTSPVNAIKITEKICDAICEIDEKNAEIYRQNAEKYIEQLNELDENFKNTVNNAQRKTLVFGDRFPLLYFVKAYGLEYFAAFPGCSSASEPSAATLAFLIDKVKKENIPVVFHTELSNEKTADIICEETGAKKMQFNACHNLTKNDFESGVTYLELMNRNVEALKEALN